MSLFQKSVLNKNLQMLVSEKIDSAYEIYSKTFCNKEKVNNIKKLKKEEYQATFLTDLFVDVFEYVLNPNIGFNLKTEFKNTSDSKKVDGAIFKDENPLGVIELKSTKTVDLKSVEPQAFGYKNDHPTCRYVIISNFSKLRLYIDATNEYEEFNLFDMDKETFKLLYLFLHKDFLLTEKTIKMKEDSKFHEEEITKKLYTDYHRFKNNIFSSMIKNNPQIDKVTLLKKSQKLLDRMLFIFFAEDRGLLEVNTISKIIEHNKKLHKYDVDESLYETYKRYFKYIDEGKQTDDIDIPKYNGGLFAFDEILDNFIIDDGVLREDALKLSAYDFNSDIDVNILGHIFENSLNDIDELHAEVEGREFDKTKSKRKKDGVFYTPKYITKYIVENTIGKLCEDKKKELDLYEIILEDDYKLVGKKAYSKKGNKLLDEIYKYRNWLLELKILDPACGSGAFLNEAMAFLIHEHEINDGLEKHITGETLFKNVEISILENNIYGVDINDESVEIAKLSLWLRTAERGRLLSDLSGKIKCGNSLISDPEVAGDKAFDWIKEFPEIMNNGGFDVVIGNPPYGAALSDDARTYLENQYKLRNTDTACIFIGHAINVLNNTGVNGFIIPKPFVYASNWKTIREKILSNISEIVDCGKVWKEVKLEQIIYFIDKSKTTDFYNSSVRKNTEIVKIGDIDKVTFEKFGFYLNGISSEELSIGEKMLNVGTFLNDYISNSRGAIYQKNVVDSISDYKVLGGKQVRKYYISDNSKGFISKTIVTDAKALIKENSILVQRIVAHVMKPTPHIKITASLPTKINHTKYIIVDTINQLTNTGILSSNLMISIINSKLISWYAYRFIYGMAIRTMQFDNPVTTRIPIPKNINQESQDKLVSLVDQMLEAQKELHDCKSDDDKKIYAKRVDLLDKQIDKLIYELYSLTEEEIKIVEGN